MFYFMQKNSNYYKRPPSKSIIFDEPKDRYVIDITELPTNFDNISNNKYLLNIIEHFSKLCKSYALKNKKSDIILNCLKDFIELYGMPKSIGTDNGREFKNIILKNYMYDNNIKYITGLAYKPHLQGVC